MISIYHRIYCHFNFTIIICLATQTMKFDYSVLEELIAKRNAQLLAGTGDLK